ncbi:MAG TPA: 50S ribosomal protein L21 [Anaerolineales bacterium]|nr:50S ribosomal protein L21 [Anaerolineales bacterium]
MKYAIVQSGGKQYRCEEGATVEVDRLPVEAGAAHDFTEVLLIAHDGDVKVGAPTVAGASVTATVLEQIKGPKLTVFRYKAKERQRRKAGHRQQYTRLKIEKISG